MHIIYTITFICSYVVTFCNYFEIVSDKNRHIAIHVQAKCIVKEQALAILNAYYFAWAFLTTRFTSCNFKIHVLT